MTLEIQIENIAGIKNGSAMIEEGINAVRGSNWQGKSSFLTAVQVVMGTKMVLREGADHGSVELVTDDSTYEVELVRENGTVVRGGESYLKDEQIRACADLYTFLDETNEIRRAVRNGENLEELLTRPLDLENIDEQIASLRDDRDRIDADLEEAENAATQLPNVERSIHQLEDELKSLREKRAELAEEASDSSGKRDELRQAITDRKQTAETIERLERTVERTKERLSDHRETLDDLDLPDVDEDLEKRISEAESELSSARRAADLLQSIYAPTKRVLEENRLELLTDVEPGLVEDTVSCWSCGEETSRERIEEQVDQLGDKVTKHRAAVDEYERELEQLTERRSEYETTKRRKNSLEREISDLESTLADRTASLQEARDRLEDLEARIDELSAEVESDDEQLTDVESEIKYAKQRLKDNREERASLEAQAEQRDHIESQREELSEEINDLRSRKETLKRRTREAFESAMQQVLERFGTGFESARLTANFDIVIARDGREADLAALSDGEVELLGIFAALAGYEAFEATDEVPVMLVDDLGGLADENLRELVEYLEDRATYLVFTAYPEHSSIESNTVDPSEWNVVSPESARHS
jgi:smc-like protein Sph1